MNWAIKDIVKSLESFVVLVIFRMLLRTKLQSHLVAVNHHAKQLWKFSNKNFQVCTYIDVIQLWNLAAQ